MLETKLIHEFQKNSREKVKVELGNYRGTDVIIIWVYYNAGETKEDWQPTRRGISMSINHITELKEGVDKAHKEWQEQIRNTN